MRGFHTAIALFLLASTPGAFAQKFEIGGGVGASFYTGKDITGRNNAAGTFKPASSWGVTAAVGHNLYDYVGGEFRFTLQKNDLQLQSSGTTAKFGAQSSAFHYDVLIHTASVRQRIRPFVAFGGGVKMYQGMGKEVVAQPLANLAFLTKTTETKPVIDFGAGVKVKLSDRILLRADLRDYFGPVPTKVVAPAPGAKLDGWFHNFVAMVGISLLF